MRKVSVGREISDTTEYTLYTVPAGYRASWNLLYLINNTASAKGFTVTWKDENGDDVAHVFLDFPVSANQYIMFNSGAWVNLESGHSVTVKCEDSGAHGDVIASFELERNNG
jgi:hypothetical protein